MRARRLVDAELEDIGAVVVADDVERLLFLGDHAEIEVPVDDRLLARGRLGDDRAVRGEDGRPRLGRAGGGLHEVVGSAHRLGQLEALRQHVGGHARAHHADGEAPSLERVVPACEAMQLRVAHLGPGGHMDLLALGVHREARQRHPVLPADESPDTAGRRCEHLQAAPVALTPDDALGVRRHDLAVDAEDRSVRGHVEERVVERPARGVASSLGHAHDEHDAVGPCRRAERVGGTARHGHGTGVEAPVHLLGAGVLPACRAEDPRRIAGNPALRERDQGGAVPRRFPDQGDGLGDPGVQVEEGGRRLDGGDAYGAGRHRAIVLALRGGVKAASPSGR